MKNGVIEVTGMVLNVMPVGEKDRRVKILTLDQGKLSCFARGAEKPGSPFMGAARPLAYGVFGLFQGRDAFTMVSADVKNYFEEITKDVETACYGMYFLEMADYYGREFVKEPRLLKLVYAALLALEKPSIPHELTRRIFELKSLVIDGTYDPEPPLPGSDPCRYTWHFICETPVERLFTFTVTEEILRVLGENTDASMARYLDRTFHSLEVLRAMKMAPGGKMTPGGK